MIIASTANKNVATPKPPSAKSDTPSQTLLESVGDEFVDGIASQAPWLGAIQGAGLGAQAALTITGGLLGVLPALAIAPALIVGGVAGLAGVMAGGIIGHQISDKVVHLVADEGDKLAQKVGLPKGSGKVLSGAAWLGVLATTFVGTGALGGLALGATGLMLAVNGAVGAKRWFSENKEKTPRQEVRPTSDFRPHVGMDVVPFPPRAARAS